MSASRLSSATAAGAGYEAAGALRGRSLPAREPSVAGSEGRRRAGRLPGPGDPPLASLACCSPVVARPPRKAEGGRGPTGPSATPRSHSCLACSCLHTAQLAVPGAEPA